MYDACNDLMYILLEKANTYFVLGGGGGGGKGE